VDDQCGDLKPCFGSIYTATMTGGAKNGDTLVVLPGAHDRDIVYQTATLGDLRITSLDRDKTSFEKGLLVYGDIGAKGELWIDHLTFRKSGPVTSNVEDGWGIYVTDWDSVQVRIQDNVFADVASNGGLALSSDTVKTHFHAVVARNEFIHNTGPRGGLYIDVADESPDYCFRVENNVFTANTVGVSVGDPFGDPASQFEIVNNTIAGNDRGLEMSSGLTLKVTNNIVFANKQDLAANAELAGVGAFDHNLISSGQFTGLRGNFSADPLFADLNNADLHLLPGSPAAARGTVLPSPDTDLDGRARGVHPDVGAYERLEHRGEALAGLACGDGVAQWGAVQTPQGSFVGFETCDDGNRVDGDGCSSFCQLEARATLGQMSRAGSTGLCAIRSDRSLSCWDDIATGVPKGSFSQVVVGDGYACALDTAKLVQCWLPGGLKGAYAPSGQFLQIAQGPYE